MAIDATKKKLELVKNLKKRLHVGTADAFMVTQGMEEIDLIPERAAESINSGIKGGLTYPAEPYRLVCLAWLASSARSDARVLNLHTIPLELDLRDLFEHEVLHAKTLPNTFLPYNSKMLYGNLEENFGGYFVPANAAGIKTDSEFKDVVAREQRRGTEEWIRRNADGDEGLLRAYADSALEIYAEKWAYGFSRVAAKEATSYMKDMLASIISASTIGRKIIRDGLDRNMEYQRMLAREFVIDGDFPAYDAAYQSARHLLNFVRDLDRKGRAMGLPDDVGTRQADTYEFLIRCLAVNKRYIQRNLTGEIK